jgi:VCBS repeat-containing protein
MTFAAQNNVKGKNGTFNIDASGRWNYTANSAFDELDEGQSVSDRFMVVSKDGTSTSVQITIEGSEESRFNSGWIGAKLGINRSNLNGMEIRDALYYGIEEGTTWKVGILQLGVYGALEFNNTASGPVNYGSSIITIGGKLGIPAGKWQPYAKLGMARTNGTEAANAIGASHVYRALGLEYKMNDYWSISGEYSSSNGDTVIQGVESKLSNRNISIGLNFYFGVPAPVIKPVPKKAPVLEPKTAPESEPESEPESAPTSEPAFAPAFGPAPKSATEPAPEPKPAPEPATAPTVTPAFGPAPKPATEPAPEPKPASEPATAPAFTPAFAPVPTP